MAHDKEFDALLINYRRFELAGNDLAERIMFAAHMRVQKRPFSFGGRLAEIVSILLPKPAYAVAAAFALGIGVGASLSMASPYDHGDDVISYDFYTD